MIIHSMLRSNHSIIAIVISVALVILCLTACGDQEISFGEEIFYGVKAAEELSFTNKWKYPVQVAVGESHLWTLTAGRGDCVYEREFETGTVRSLGQWENNELVMGISAVGDLPYACVACDGTVEIRKFTEDGHWENVTSLPWEEVANQPTVFFMDRNENAYIVNGDEVWRYSPGEGHRTVYRLKAPVAFLQEKKPGVVEAVVKTGGEILLYALEDEGRAERKWTLKLSTSHLSAIQTDDAVTLVLAVDDRVLFINDSTGEIVFYFDSIAAGVSTNLLGGLCLVEEGSMYLVEQTAGKGGLWEELAAQSGPWGDRTVLVYGTVSLSETMKERIVSFNKTNQNYYITVEEYGSGDPWAGRLQIQAAVTSGHGPDIVDLYGLENYISYAEKGYLEDLEPYLLKEDFSDDILWQVQDLYRVEGKVCMLVPHFTVRGLAVNPEYAKGMESWNFETFKELAELARGEKLIVEGGTAGSIFVELFVGMQGEFIDWKRKEAYFDTPQFVSFLELCKKYEGKSLVRNGVSYDSDEFVDMVLLMRLGLSNPMGYAELHAYYGEDALPYGYPVADGQVLLVNNDVDACGILVSSGNKEGAWEFLRTLLVEDYQEQMTGYRSAWSIRESCWYSMWNSYKSSTVLGFNNVMLDPPTDEDVELFADVILNGNLSANLMNYKIEEVVTEEAGAYFDGDISAEEAASRIQNRVQLMLEE